MNMNGRNYHPVTLIPLSALSCSTQRYNKICSNEDEFPGTKKDYVSIRLKHEEKRTEIGPAKMIFKRKSHEKPADAYFVIYRADSGSAAEFSLGMSYETKSGFG